MKGVTAWSFLRLHILILTFFSANAISNVSIPLRGHDLGVADTTIGIIAGAYMLAVVVFRPWAGQIITRVGSVEVLRITLIINVMALIIYGFTGLEGHFVARVVQGVYTAFFSMSLQLGVIDALSEEHRSEDISLYSLSSAIPSLIGLLVAVGIWNANNISLFAIVIIFTALTTTFSGHRVTFTEQKPNTSDKIEEMPFDAVTVFVQFFKNKGLLNSGITIVIAPIMSDIVSTFVSLYTMSLGLADAGIFLTIQATVVVMARFYLRKYIPSDGMWYPKYMVSVLLLLVIASLVVAFGPQVGAIIFHGSTILIGMTQTVIYPTLTSYLSFILPKIGRNMLLGLFIACADSGISLSGALMGPISDLVGFKWMYLICGMLVIVIMIMSLLRKPTPRPVNSPQRSELKHIRLMNI